MSDTKNTPISDLLETALSSHPCFPQDEVGQLRLTRSVISKSNRAILSFHLDIDSSYHFSAHAHKLGLTPDELLRQLVWLLVAEQS